MQPDIKALICLTELFQLISDSLTGNCRHCRECCMHKFAEYSQHGRGGKSREAGGARERDRDHYLSLLYGEGGALIASVLCQLYISVH